MGRTGVAWLVVGAALAASQARAELFSKTYVFKANTPLEVGADFADGLRIESVTLHFREAGPPVAEVVVSNLGERPRRVGIALALLDRDNRLVAATNGGTKLFPLRPERRMNYRLAFDAVNGEAADAAVFMLAVETRR